MADPAATPELLPLGLDAIAVRFATVLDDTANRAAIAFRGTVEAANPPWLVETASSLASVLVRFDRGRTTRAAVIDALQALLADHDGRDAGPSGAQRLWRVPTAFGGEHGPQLAEAAGLAGLSEDAAIRDIASARVRVLAIGFAPGQPYLGMLPDRWDLPRQRELTPSVPGGALVVAVRQLVLFTNASPTGWRQIGRTAFRCFRPDSGEPFPLRAGDMIQFTPVSADTYRSLAAADDGGNGGATCEALA